MDETRKNELKELAKDLHAGRIFSNLHCPSVQQIRSSFIVATLAGVPDEAAMIYEYMDKAGPMAVNGFPTFMSCRVLNREEFEFMRERVEKIEAAMKAID